MSRPTPLRRPSILPGGTRFATALLAVLALTLAACSDDGGADEASDVPDGPTVEVASFNFPESEILAEVYAQAMEDVGYPVGRSLNLGARDLIYPDLLGGDITFVPEYLGSALLTWFEEDAPEDVDAGVDALNTAFADDGVQVLEPAPAENANTFVVTSEFAETNDVTSVSDLADAGELTFAGPPECEERATCYAGLTDTYGLDNVEFVSVQEASARLAALEEGEYDVILLFSTDAPLAGDALTALEDDQDIIPPENIVPVLREEAVDAYGEDLTGLIDGITAEITTDVLQQMNADASEGESAAGIAEAFLQEIGVL